ncbi:protein HBS1 [Halyomorpha halys]|uniref:protein HBS1 n=1 Tax=Halyomorpha halys TaxID=286706 RepID=UPI0006D506D4|nr:HBS1-like protein [Halyomorpha halys]
MSRHRNVRSMRYSDEYDGYDDVYGHSVEDDYSISPSDAAFMYDRSTQQRQISSLLSTEENIAEEDEVINDQPEILSLNELEKAKLMSCLDEMRNVLGDSIPEQTLSETIISSNYDITIALDKVLNKSVSSQKKGKESPKPQRTTPFRRYERAQAQGEPAATPVVTVVPSPAKTNIVKGFHLPQENIEDKKSSLNARCSSPMSGRASPESTFVKSKSNDQTFKTSRNTVKAEELFQKERGDTKSQLHMVVIGHVDAGKSTLMGHLLYKLGHISSKVMHKFEQESKKIGKQSFIYAWILDETGEERSRGITMDVGQSKFETNTKIVTLLDAPGHKDFIPNMITGAAQADVSLLVVDSTRGEFETGFESGGQTREHALLVRSLGVSQICVVVNKLDTVSWSEERFLEIQNKLGAFLKQAGFKERDISFVPCSGLSGENLTEKSKLPELNKWYKGPCLLEVVDKFHCPERPVSKPLRLLVNDIFKATGSGFCISGRIETGIIQVGDKVLVQPQNESALIKAITIDELSTQTAYAGDFVSATLSNYDQDNISIGSVLCDPTSPVPSSSKFEARVVIFNTIIPITKGYSVVLHLHCITEQAIITKLISQVNKNTGEVIKKKPRCLLKNNSAVVVIETSKPICIELYREMKELGRFMLRVGGVTIAAGLITKIL